MKQNHVNKKQISCGILMINSKHELFLEKIMPTPTNRWIKNKYDIPKGQCEENEDYLTAALRELYEEAFIEIEKEDYKDIINLGLHYYNQSKDLNLFLFYDKKDKYLNEKNILNCQCISTFIDIDNKEYKEVEGYKCVPLEEIFKQFEILEKGTNKDCFLNKSLILLLKKLEKNIMSTI